MPVTTRGFQQTATRNGAIVVDTGDEWSHIIHPVTGSFLQRDPKGYLTVHTAEGSWSEGVNSARIIRALWAAKF